MSEILGAYDPTAFEGDLRLTMHQDGSALHWTLCGATADFTAEYFAVMLPERAAPDALHRSKMANTISYVVNELVENAVKFNREEDVGIAMELRDDELVCVVSNHIATEDTPAVRARLGEIADTDPGELVLRQVEANAAAAKGTKNSGLGLALIMSDYHTKLGWKLERLSERVWRLNTMARIPVPSER